MFKLTNDKWSGDHHQICMSALPAGLVIVATDF